MTLTYPKRGTLVLEAHGSNGHLFCSFGPYQFLLRHSISFYSRAAGTATMQRSTADAFSVLTRYQGS
jgi:hypothetical protein